MAVSLGVAADGFGFLGGFAQFAVLAFFYPGLGGDFDDAAGLVVLLEGRAGVAVFVADVVAGVVRVGDGDQAVVLVVVVYRFVLQFEYGGDFLGGVGGNSMKARTAMEKQEDRFRAIFTADLNPLVYAAQLDLFE